MVRLLANVGLCCAQFVVAQVALGLVVERLPLESFVSQAAVVARVSVTSAEPMHFAGDGGQPCGFRIRTKVLQSFKGGSGEVTFFLPTPDDLAGLDRQYFIVVFERDEQAVEALRASDRASLSGPELEWSLCQLRELRFMKQHTQMMIPFAQAPAGRAEEEEWLRASRDSIVTDNRFELVPPDSNGTARLVRWRDVEKAIFDGLRLDSPTPAGAE